MNWLERSDSWLASPYRVYRSVQGFTAWFYGKDASCLGRGIGTLEAAKALCAAHKAKAEHE